MRREHRQVSCLVVACGIAGLSALSGLAAGDQPRPAAAPAATQALLDATPGLHASMHDGRVLRLWGVPMGAAKDPRSAAEAWLAGNGVAFGVGPLDLFEDRIDEINFGEKTFVRYRQVMGGVPVEQGFCGVLVLNTAQDSRVVSASGRLAPRPVGGFAPDAVGAKEAIGIVAQADVFKRFTNWSEPELVVYYGEGDLPRLIPAVRAWKFTGEIPDPDGERYQKKSFFVGAADGRLLFVRNEKLEIDVVGRVVANATPFPLGNAAADHPGNPPAQVGVPNILVQIAGGNQAYTDDNGFFTIPNAGTTPVTVTASVGDGRWARVADQGGTPLISDSVSATPGVQATLVLNQTPGEFTTAQANAFIHQTITHNHFKSRAPSFTALDTQFPANTQVSGSCNAFYNGISTNFYNYNAGAGCNNTAFSSVVAHEYGHHIVNRLGLAQGAFGEGFGDTMSMMIHDDPVIGRYFRISGSPVRTPDSANIQYPCTGGVHFCGQVLGNIVWELRKAFVQQYGLTNGRDMVRQMHVDWALTASGGLGSDSAHPDTLLEWLEADDNDGNLNNGSPNYCMIVGAFAQGGIPEPWLTPSVSFSFPDGMPQNFLPGVPTNFRVNVSGGSPLQNSAVLYWRRAGQATYTSVPMSMGAVNQYTATMPAMLCGADVQFYFGVASNSGPVVYPFAWCSQPFFSAPVAAITQVFSDNVESGPNGWTVDELDTATTGRWVRGDPIGTTAQPEDAASPVNCWFTGQGTAGGGAGAADVDGGYTRLISPVLNLDGFTDAEVRYQRWYSNDASGAPNADIFYVDVSSNGGASWNRAQTIGPAGPFTHAGWFASTFRFASAGITPTANTLLRFTAEDLADGSLIEAAIDDVVVIGINCTNPPGCPADYNNSGGVPDDADVAAFFVDWNNGDPRADMNGSGGTPDDADVAYFFQRWNAGC